MPHAPSNVLKLAHSSYDIHLRIVWRIWKRRRMWRNDILRHLNFYNGMVNDKHTLRFFDWYSSYTMSSSPNCRRIRISAKQYLLRYKNVAAKNIFYIALVGAVFYYLIESKRSNISHNDGKRLISPTDTRKSTTLEQSQVTLF